MTPEQEALLSATIAHFQEIARQNRFAENGSIPHDEGLCAICRPELVSEDPFCVYLDVITQCVKVRRPRLDEPLVDEMNKDLALMGEDFRVSLESIRAGDERSLKAWSEWIRDALSTGLGLLSVHSRT
ncbi:MAG: hypothetical protein ACLGPL_09095, partial [Acidobacteriota bacterium]